MAETKVSANEVDFAGVWVSWTPTLANLSGGTLNFAKYTQIGKTVQFRFKYTLGGAGVGTGPTFTAPVTPHADEMPAAGYNIIGTGSLLDAGIANYFARAGFAATNAIQIIAEGVGATYGAPAGPSSTVPFTWGSGDILFVRGSYEIA